jgi:hypothetical protein
LAGSIGEWVIAAMAIGAVGSLTVGFWPSRARTGEPAERLSNRA